MDTTTDIIKLAVKIATDRVVELLSENPRTISAKAAKRKYKGLLTLWESQGLVCGIPTANGKHICYPEQTLINLYTAYTSGTL